MGTSGAGKTTLMDVLAGRKTCKPVAWKCSSKLALADSMMSPCRALQMQSVAHILLMRRTLQVQLHADPQLLPVALSCRDGGQEELTFAALPFKVPFRFQLP